MEVIWIIRLFYLIIQIGNCSKFSLFCEDMNKYFHLFVFEEFETGLTSITKRAVVK